MFLIVLETLACGLGSPFKGESKYVISVCLSLAILFLTLIAQYSRLKAKLISRLLFPPRFRVFSKLSMSRKPSKGPVWIYSPIYRRFSRS